MVQVVSTFDRLGKEIHKVKCGCGLDKEVSSSQVGLQEGEDHRKTKGHAWDYPRVQVFNTFGDTDRGFPTLETSDRSVLQ